MRRSNRAGTENDIACGTDMNRVCAFQHAYANRLFPFKHQAGYMRLSANFQVWPSQGRTQKSVGSAVASTIPLRDLIETKAFLGLAIKIRIARKPGLRPRFDKCLGKRIDAALVAHMEGTVF